MRVSCGTDEAVPFVHQATRLAQVEDDVVDRVSRTYGNATLQVTFEHFYLSLFGLKVKNFRRPTGCIHITKDIDKMARMGDIASAASD